MVALACPQKGLGLPLSVAWVVQCHRCGEAAGGKTVKDHIPQRGRESGCSRITLGTTCCHQMKLTAELCQLGLTDEIPHLSWRSLQMKCFLLFGQTGNWKMSALFSDENSLSASFPESHSPAAPACINWSPEIQLVAKRSGRNIGCSLLLGAITLPAPPCRCLV